MFKLCWITFPISTDSKNDIKNKLASIEIFWVVFYLDRFFKVEYCYNNYLISAIGKFLNMWLQLS